MQETSLGESSRYTESATWQKPCKIHPNGSYCASFIGILCFLHSVTEE